MRRLEDREGECHCIFFFLSGGYEGNALAKSILTIGTWSLTPFFSDIFEQKLPTKKLPSKNGVLWLCLGCEFVEAPTRMWIPGVWDVMMDHFFPVECGSSVEYLPGP